MMDNWTMIDRRICLQHHQTVKLDRSHVVNTFSTRLTVYLPIKDVT